MAGGMSGFDVVRWARKNVPHLKIILASGYPDEVLKSELSDWRSMTLLRKPFSRTELARAVRRVLDQD